MNLKDLANLFAAAVADGCRYWPILVSTGLVIIEIRRLRSQLEILNQDFLKIVETSASGSRRSRFNSISGTSTDDWFSIYDSDEDDDADLTEEDKELIKRVDALHYSGDKGIRDAWDILKDIDHSKSIEFLWRKTRSQCSMYGQYRAGTEMGDNPTLRKEYAQRGLTWAEELIRRAPRLNHGHRYKAAALGCNMEFFPIKEKVGNGKVVKDCIDEALRCNPDDGSAHYILGRFYVELLKLPWAVRSMASSIGIPAASPDDAVKHLERSKGSSGHDKDVALLLHKLYKDLGKTSEARSILEWGTTLPVVYRSDQVAQTEIEKLLT